MHGLLYRAQLFWVLLVVGMSLPVRAQSPEFRWFDPASGLEEARRSGKPMLIAVYTDWCSWCRRMDREVYSRSDVQAYLGRTFVPIRLNAEDTESRFVFRGQTVTPAQLARAFRVSGYPTTLFLEPDGTLIAPLPGYHPPDRFLLILGYVGERAFERMPFEDFVRMRAPQ
jgi:thioredoxin-related protein